MNSNNSPEKGLAQHAALEIEQGVLFPWASFTLIPDVLGNNEVEVFVYASFISTNLFATGMSGIALMVLSLFICIVVKSVVLPV